MNAQTAALAEHLKQHFPETQEIHYLGVGQVERISCACQRIVFSDHPLAREKWAAHVAMEWSGAAS